MRIKVLLLSFFLCSAGNSLLAEIQFSLICDKIKFVDVHKNVYSKARGHSFNDGRKPFALLKKDDKYFVETGMFILNKKVVRYNESDAKYSIFMEVDRTFNRDVRSMVNINRYSGELVHSRWFPDDDTIELHVYECKKAKRKF